MSSVMKLIVVMMVGLQATACVTTDSGAYYYNPALHGHQPTAVHTYDFYVISH